MSLNETPDSGLACPSCQKEAPLCLCAEIQKIPTTLEILILQHPQEPDKTLGSARLAATALERSTLRVGLSWPNLSKALGREANPARWGVLYLGSKQEKPASTEKPPRLQVQWKGSHDFEAVDLGSRHGLEGIIVLDGTWSQAKTLWWRNPWMLKLNRIVLHPQRASFYGKLRREPRREALSTIEAIAETLEALGEDPKVSLKLRQHFSTLLRRYREWIKTNPQPISKPRRHGRFRPRQRSRSL